LFFKTSDADPGKLYQYLALEPYNTDKEGLSIDFYVPADGIGPIYRYRDFAHHEAPLGPTAVADQVRASRKLYDWAINKPVEVRPYNHKIADGRGQLKVRRQWMTTVVTVKKNEEGKPLQFTAGSDPEIAMTDVLRGRVVWVDHYDPSKWPQQLKEALGSLWASDSP
jgi:hypothetical protein